MSVVAKKAKCSVTVVLGVSVFIVGVGVLGIMIAKCVKKQRAKKAVPAA